MPMGYCHGTPISIRAKKEDVNPKEIVDRYHNEFKYCLDKLGFSYDIYSRTDDYSIWKRDFGYMGHSTNYY